MTWLRWGVPFAVVVGYTAAGIVRAIRSSVQEERDLFGKMILVVEEEIGPSWEFGGFEIAPRWPRRRSHARAWWTRGGYTIELNRRNDGHGYLSAPEIDRALDNGEVVRISGNGSAS